MDCFVRGLDFRSGCRVGDRNDLNIRWLNHKISEIVPCYMACGPVRLFLISGVATAIWDKKQRIGKILAEDISATSGIYCWMVTMNVDEIFENLESSREDLLLVIQELPDEAWSQSGVNGDWSMTDILVHIVTWESELVTCLMKLDQGKKPSRMLAAVADVDGYNARRYEENKDRDLDRIFDDLRNVRIQLEEWLPRFSNQDLNDGNRYEWCEGVALWQIIEANSFGHEGEHMPDIEAFVHRWREDQTAG